MPNLTLSVTAQQSLADALHRELQASRTAKGTLPQRWKRAKDLYDVAPGTTNLQIVEGMEPYPLPILTQKIDKIRGSSVSALCDAYPMVQCLIQDPQKNGDVTNEEALESTLMALAEESDLEASFDRAVQEALLTNNGWMRVRPVVDPKVQGGLKLVTDWGEPEDLMVYPSDWGKLSEAKTVGHRTYEMLYRVQEKQKNGTFFTGELVGGMGPKGREQFGSSRDDLSEATPPQMPSDAYVELWEMVSERDLGQGYKKYLCVLALPTIRLMSCQLYGEPEYPKSWYVDVSTNPEGNKVWRNASVAQKAQGACLLRSDTMTTAVHGSYMSAFPPVLLSGGSMITKAKKYGPAQVWEAPAGVVLQSVPIQFNPGMIAWVSEEADQLIDAVTGINRIGNGENLPSGTTATAIDSLMNAQAESKDNYTSKLSASIQESFELYLMFLRQHFDQLKATYGDKIKYQSADQIPKTVTLVVTGQNASATPDMNLKKLSALSQIAQQPTSEYDVNKINDRIVQALDLPFATDGLKKDDISQWIQAGQQLEAQGMDPAQVLQAGIQSVQQGQQPEGNKMMESININDLPPVGQVQMAAQAGIQTTVEDWQAHQAIQLAAHVEGSQNKNQQPTPKSAPKKPGGSVSKASTPKTPKSGA